MKVLWFTWKDYTHPQAGGAEIVLRELSKRLVADGHSVTFLTVRHPGSKAYEILDGIEIIRIGTRRCIHPLQALIYYLRHLHNQYDIVIEVVNTAPYFGALFKGKARAFIFYHQLAREVWFYELKKPFSNIGYHIMEPLATWIMSRARAKLITVSRSTLTDLERFGFSQNQAHIIAEGSEIEPVKNLGAIRKFSSPTMLSLGAMRAMKRTLDQVKAYEIAKKSLPGLRLIIAGSAEGDYGRRVLDYIAASPYKKDISIEGKISYKRKIKLMQRCHIIAVTSIKEGWGLVVTEAASQGTPAIVYDTDGLRDSVRHNQTGIVTVTNPQALAEGILQLLERKKLYQTLQQNAWQWSKELTFDASYRDFALATEIV